MDLRGSFLLLLCITASLGSVAQIDIRQYTTATDTFYWKRYIRVAPPPKANLKRYRTANASKQVALFLANRAQYLPELSSDSSRPPIPEREVSKHLFPIDFDGDRTPDMVFSGPLNGEPGLVRIWLAKDNGFRLVFEDYQYLSDLRRESGRITALQTADAGSDTGYLYFTRDYKIRDEGGSPVFVKGKQSVIYKNTEEPSRYLEHPFQFTSRTDSLMLRASAARQNEPFIPWLGSFGNIVARYRATCQGTALAIKTVGNGNTWYFVEMSPAIMPSASIFYGIETFPTWLRGWVSAEGIRPLP